MSKDEAYLKHIRDSIKRIDKYSKGLDKKGFLMNEMVQDAIMRQIEIIGEIGVDLEAVWNTVKKDIPELKSKLKEL